MGLRVLARPLAKFIEFVKALAKRPQKSMGATTEPGRAVRYFRLRGAGITSAAKNSQRSANLIAPPSTQTHPPRPHSSLPPNPPPP